MPLKVVGASWSILAEAIVVVLLVGLQAGNKLYSAFMTRSNVFVTTTYHTVLVANDKRNLATLMAARLTLAAGARLMRLALNVLIGLVDRGPDSQRGDVIW